MIVLPLAIKNIVGWLIAHWRIVAGAVAVLFLVIAFGLLVRSCNKPAKLDHKEIQKAQEAIAKEDRRVMIEVLTNSKVAEQGIDNSIKAAEQVTEAAKQDYSGKSNAELAAELERRLQQ